MSVEQVDVVDSIGVDSTSGKLIMTISDHLDWDKDGNHQAILQEKLNTYLTFIESDQLTTAYPDSIGRPIAIAVVMRTFPTPESEFFFEQVKLILAGIDIELRTTILESADGELHSRTDDQRTHGSVHRDGRDRPVSIRWVRRARR